MDKKCLMKINMESRSPPEIWIRILFNNRSGSPSLIVCIPVKMRIMAPIRVPKPKIDHLD